MQCNLVPKGLPRPSVKRKRLQSAATSNKGDRIFLNKSLIRFGVNEDACDVVLDCITEPTGTVRDVFATLSFNPTEGAWYLNDLGTPQGIFVKGVKSEQVPILLTNNAEIRFVAPYLNHCVVYRFRVESSLNDEAIVTTTPHQEGCLSQCHKRKTVRSASTTPVDQSPAVSTNFSEREGACPVDFKSKLEGVSGNGHTITGAAMLKRAYLEIVEDERRDLSDVGTASQSVKEASTEKIELTSLIKELSCSICLELICQSSNLECGHSFCRCCIDMWLSSKLSCPVCRAAVTSLPGSALALDKLVLSTIEGDPEDKKRYLERKKASDERDNKSARRKAKFEEMVRNATSGGHTLVSISTPWSERETKRVLRYIQAYYGQARKAYCESLCLDEDFVFRAPLSDIKTAITNVQLKRYPKFPASETHTGEEAEEADIWKDATPGELRRRLLLFIYYS